MFTGPIDSIFVAGDMIAVRGDWQERIEALRHNYARYARGVDEGLVSWTPPCDHFMIAPWYSLMTPIEREVWDEMRSEGLLSFWPQFPIDRYVADFADPVRRIVLECDGKDYHYLTEEQRTHDRERDARLKSLGWLTLRASGRAIKNEHIVFRDRAMTPFSIAYLASHEPLGHSLFYEPYTGDDED